MIKPNKNQCFLVIACSLVCFGFPLGTGRAALVFNGDFTQENEGAVAGWKESGGKRMSAIPLHGTVLSEKDEKISLDKEPGDKPVFALKIESQGDNGGDCLLKPGPFPLQSGYGYEISFRYKAEGLIAENTDTNRLVAIICDLYLENEKGRLTSIRVKTVIDSKGWVTLSKRFIVPEGATKGQLRFQLSNRMPGAKAKAWIADVKVEPQDPTLPNGNFEKGTAPATVENWKIQGGGQSIWTTEQAHSGKASIAVSNAPNLIFSGWTTDVPVRSDRSYSLSGYVKARGLNPNGHIAGGVLVVQFLGADGREVGAPIISPPVGGNADWTQVETRKAQPPAGAISARLMAAMEYANGTAWFDDLQLAIGQTASLEVAHVKRQNPTPAVSVTYAKNLLVNGDLEKGKGANPTGWTYSGKSTQDWTDAEITEFHTNGRPNPNMGRGQGVWEHGVVYNGTGALLNISIDPPLSKTTQWHGKNPVDGCWLSDAMPCVPDAKYMASAWIRMGVNISGHGGAPWYGPLEIRFYDRGGKLVNPKVGVRSVQGRINAGVWTQCLTAPYQAPANATTMRLRFGQELAADSGGYGRTYGDNFALWQLPDSTPLPDYQMVQNNFSAFRPWYLQATEKVKPPYLPSPTDAPEYESVLGSLVNSAPGNIFYDAKANLKVKFFLSSLIGESRTDLSMKIVRYDAWGKESEPVILSNLALPAYGTSTVEATLPPTGSFGAFYLDATVYEGKARVGDASGRLVVLPQLNRPHSSENPFGVTLIDETDGGFSYSKERKQELGEMLRVAGFGIGWTRFVFDIQNEAKNREMLDYTRQNVEWFSSLGIRSVVRLNPTANAGVPHPLNLEAYKAIGSLVGKELKNKVLAYGDWGIEQANSKSPYRGGGRDRWTDAQYDATMLALYQGIKAEDPNSVVLTGNIATDPDAVTLSRLYAEPVNGHLDGVILNSYFAQVKTCQAHLKLFDEHGDKNKTIWLEEMATQMSPFEGEARRYGEVQGAENMVRVWLSLLGKFTPRLKAVTMWGFVARSPGEIMMVTPSLQPRPQFAAHAIMSNALADGTFVADRSQGNISLIEWNRPNHEVLLAGWSNAGNQSLALEVPTGTLKVMDIFGNVREITPVHGLVTVKLTPSPVYLIGDGGLAVSKIK